MIEKQFEQVLKKVRQSRDFRQLSDEQKENHARLIVKDPRRLESFLAEETITRGSTKEQVRELHETVEKTTAATKKFWQPDNIEEYLLPGEQRMLQLYKFADNWLSPLLGQHNATTYLAQVTPEALKRYQNTYIANINRKRAIVTDYAEKAEVNHEKFQQRAEQYQQQVSKAHYNLDTAIEALEINRGRQQQLKEQQKEYMRKGEYTKLKALQDEFRQCQDEEKFYKNIRSNTNKEILRIEGRFHHTLSKRNIFRSLEGKFSDMRDHYDIKCEQFEFYTTETDWLMNTEELSTLVETYEEMEKLLVGLEDNLQESIHKIKEVIPEKFVTENKLNYSIDALTIDYAKDQSQREKEALKIAEQIEQIDLT